MSNERGAREEGLGLLKLGMCMGYLRRLVGTPQKSNYDEDVYEGCVMLCKCLGGQNCH